MRIGQAELRATLLETYGGCCALCETRVIDLLRASHNVRWADNVARLEPGNALLLCLTHDGLFELGFIALTDDYHVLVSPKLDRVRNASLAPMLTGLRFREPRAWSPSAAFLSLHRQRHGFPP